MRTKSPSNSNAKTLSRRAALARLGIGAAVVYAAPTVTRLDRSAQAGWSGSVCRGSRCQGGNGHGQGGRWR